MQDRLTVGTIRRYAKQLLQIIIHLLLYHAACGLSMKIRQTDRHQPQLNKQECFQSAANAYLIDILYHVFSDNTRPPDIWRCQADAERSISAVV